MKKLTLFIFISFLSHGIFGQDIVGQWNGVLEVSGMKLRLVLHITETENGFEGTLDSPDQGVKDIPASSVDFEDNTLNFIVASAGVEYEGSLENEGGIKGDFKQGGQVFPLDLTKGDEDHTLVRPQEPKRPFPYHEEEVIFKNKEAGINLAGTLTLPKKKGEFPVVVLISGSGPQNRDEEILGHKPFLIISDYLTRNGIAVLRFDDRGTAESEGDFSTATSEDFATDVQAAVEFLKSHKQINTKKIGLIGHSEGGIIAPLVATKMEDDIAFIVLLAGTGLTGGEILLLQQQLIGEASGIDEEELRLTKKLNEGAFEIVNNYSDEKQLEEELTKYFIQFLEENDSFSRPEDISTEDFVKEQVNELKNEWILFFLRHDPAPILEKVTCPVLAINGEKDLQVPPKENLSAIEAALKRGGNNQVTIKELPALNHLFQTSETGSPSEYASIEETFSPVALDLILTWINKQL